MLKFGAVGVLAFVIDLGGYNLLVFGPHLIGMLGEGQDAGAFHDKPLTARIISASAGTLVAWLGNRLWTFGHRRQRPVAHEISLFVAANIVGICLGALFRFWAYREFVFARMPLLEPTNKG